MGAGGLRSRVSERAADLSRRGSSLGRESRCRRVSPRVETGERQTRPPSRTSGTKTVSTPSSPPSFLLDPRSDLKGEGQNES